MSFFQTLLHVPGPHTPLSRYNHFCGLFYLGFGLVTYAWPSVVQFTFGIAPFAGHEEGLMRMLGFVVAVIGYLYVFGARTRSDSFGVATVVDRLLVPLFLVPLGLSGAVEPVVAYLFAGLDPVLAVGAFLIWRRLHRSPTRATSPA